MRVWSLLFVTLPLTAATEVGLRRAAPGGGFDQVLFRQEKSSWVLVKDSTLFDAKMDPRLGTLVPVSQKSFAPWARVVADVKERHAQALALLKSQGATEAQLRPPLGHAPHAIVDGQVIGPHSPGYEILAGMINLGLKEKFTLREGIEIRGDGQLHHVKNGKVESKEKFEPDNFCSSGTTPRTCNLRRWGRVYL